MPFYFQFYILNYQFKIWCSGRDSNSHGLLHTPLKRARLPITPPERFEISKNYFFGGDFFAGVLFAAFAGAVFAGVFATARLPALAACLLNSSVAGVSISAPLSGWVFAAGGGTFASALAVFEFVESTGASGLLFKTEMLPVNAGIASNKAESMKSVAAPIVTFDKTVAVPRGANAELDTLLVNNAPASVLPGCSKTAATRIMHERKNNPYKK